MKLNDKNFAVMIGGHLFTGEDIMKISVNGSSFEMVYGWCTDTDTEVIVRCKTKDVEFVESGITQHEYVCRNAKGEEAAREKAPSFEGYYMCGDRGFYGPPIGNPDDDIEVVSPLRNMMKAFNEAIEDMGETPEAIKFDISEDGKQFVKSVKLGNATRDAIKEVVREVMTEDAVERILAKKDKLEIDPDAFAKLMKKYKRDQARWSGGD
ncbi:MAG: hypothetical protein ACRC36_22350 [Lacrimispora sphenoides]